MQSNFEEKALALGSAVGSESPMVITPMALAPTLSRAAINQGMMNAA